MYARNWILRKLEPPDKINNDPRIELDLAR